MFSPPHFFSLFKFILLNFYVFFDDINMNIYNVGVRGGLKKTNNPIFNRESIVLIEDDSTIYIWFGTTVVEKSKKYAIAKAKSLNEKKKKNLNIQLIQQGNEYGAFLDIFNLLQQGDIKNIKNKRRPELEIEYENTLDFLEAGLDPDLEAEITIASHSISEENKTYEVLCKTLAKLQLSFIKSTSKITKKEIELKTKEIFSSSSTYEELCWLIAQLTVLKKKQELK